MEISILFFLAAATASLSTLTKAQFQNSSLLPGEIQPAPVTVPSVAATVCLTLPAGTMACSNEPDCRAAAPYITCTNNAPAQNALSCPANTYCVGKPGAAYCSAQPSPACTYQCVGVGYFPEIGNCNAYYKCVRNTQTNDLDSTRFECGAGQTFNPALQGCGDGYCVKAQCPNYRGTSWFPLNYQGFDKNRMAILCTNGQFVRIYQCPNNLEIDKKNFNPTCVLKCDSRNKRGPNPNDATKYYQCNGKTFSELTCPAGQTFDADALDCKAPVNG